MCGASTGAGAGAALLGRREELAELRLGLDDAMSGRGRLFLLAGEGGIGKTRLLQAFLDEVEPTEARAVLGRYWHPRATAPWGPWVQVLRAWVSGLPDDTLARHLGPGATDVAVLVPEVAQRLPDVAAGPRSDSADSRLRLFDSITEVLRRTAADGGLIVGLDDLHAADEASLRLLEHVAGELGSSNVLLVGTYRDADVRSSPHLQRLVAAIARHGRRIVLGGLDESAVATLLEQTMVGEVNVELARRVHQTTDGNPLFVQEVARLLGPEADGASVTLPEEVRDLVRRRLEPVFGSVRDVLDVAAVFNRKVDTALLQATVGVEADTFVEALEELMALDTIVEGPPGRWWFVHEVVREAVYDDIRVSRRVGLHRRAGEALEGTQIDGPRPHVAELAHHFFEAARGGDGTKAQHYCALAGDAAMAALGFEEAAIQYGRALEALAVTPPVDERERHRLLMRLGRAHVRLGDTPQARKFQRRALKSARAAGSADLLSWAAVGFIGEPEWTVSETDASILAEARAALPDDDNPALARVLVALAAAAHERKEAVDLSSQGVAMARRLGDGDTLRAVLSRWHQINHDDPDLLDDRLAVADELIGLSRQAGDAERLQNARLWRAHDLFAAGDSSGTGDELEAAAQDTERLRIPSLIARTASARAALALMQGKLDDAERLTHDALAAAGRVQLADVEDEVSYQLYALRREQGRFEEMADIARRRLESGPDHVPTADRRALLALALAETGRSEEAREEILAVGGDLVHRRGWSGLGSAAVVADVSWRIGEVRWAEATYQYLLRWPTRHVIAPVAHFSLGASDLYLGQLAALLGLLDEAESHVAAAHKGHERLGAPGWLAQGRMDHARVLLARRRPGDAARAHDLAAAALQSYRALGMAGHEQRALALMEAPAPGTGDTAEVGEFRLEGEYWVVDYGGAQARLRDSKGLRYLARLLRAPGQELHALDLVVGEGGRAGVSSGAARQAGLETVGSGDAGSILDARAKAAYKSRLAELKEAVEEAAAFHDAGRVEQAQREIDFLMAELAAAVGLGGRDRKAASDAERARQSVTRAIKGAVERISTAHPALGEHLHTTVRTGIYSSYAPDPRVPIRWGPK